MESGLAIILSLLLTANCARCAPAYYDDSSDVGQDYPSTTDDYYDTLPPLYSCRNSEIQLDYGTLCNGVEDCPSGDDEERPICKIHGVHPPDADLDVASPASSAGPTPTPTTATTTSTSTLPPAECGDDYEDYGLYDLPTCDEGQFQCPCDGLCIPSKARCDGFSDCSHSEDESGCVYPPKTTEPKKAPYVHNHHASFDHPTADLRSVEPHELDHVEHPDLKFRRERPVTPVTQPPVATTTFYNHIRRVVHRSTPPTPVFHAVPVKHHQQAGFSGVERFQPMPQKQVSPGKTRLNLAGESGYTPVERFREKLHSMTDSEVEKQFLSMTQVHRERPRQKGNRFIDNALPTVEHSPQVDRSPPVKPTKTAAAHKARVKGLLGQLMKQMGKMVAADLDNRDVDLSLKIGGSRDASRSHDSGSREPRMTFSLQIEI